MLEFRNDLRFPQKGLRLLWQSNSAIFGLTVFLLAGTAAAQDTSATAPLTPQDLRAIPSTDTTLIKVKIGKVTYAIPRNYLNYSISGLPITLKVTYPGFQPLTEETRPCMEHKIWQTCLPMEINVGLGPSNNTLMANGMKLPRNHSSDHPYGLDLYEIGPKDSRGETYRREGDDIFVECYLPGGDTNLSICDDYIDADPPNSISVRLLLMRNKLGQVAEINRQVIGLLNSLKVSEDKQ